jgi:glycogen debranching enzyme
MRRHRLDPVFAWFDMERYQVRRIAVDRAQPAARSAIADNVIRRPTARRPVARRSRQRANKSGGFMPVEVSVGPSVLTINHNSTFMVTNLNGEIAAESEQGVFASDTRLLSYYAISANSEPWVRLTSSATASYAARVFLTNPTIATEEGEIPAGTLALAMSRTIGEGIHEDLDVTNRGLAPVCFNLEIALRSDFADLFEVKAHRFVRRGRIATTWDDEHGELSTTYTNRDFYRELIYRPLNADSQPHYANGRVTWEIALDPGATWHSCCYYLFTEGEGRQAHAPIYGCYHDLGEDLATAEPAELPEPDQPQRQWREEATQLTSANEDIYRFYRKSVHDLGALRLYHHDFARDVWLPAAGLPWFATLFGRDSLIVGLQTMTVHRGLALGALGKLAHFQATKRDDERDAEPGKILHELRYGELAHFHTIPQTPYYGTADATILYPILLHETWKWQGDDTLLHTYRDVALRCLDWIDQYGDRDGDGFQEYQTRSSQGYENMGWKDAGDAVVYPDGSQVKAPKALCELQGYVFDAWLRMAEVFDRLGESERATALRRKAAGLRERFEAHFWCEEIGCYAYALDAEKQPVRTVASNAGHCLWSGIASEPHAARVVERLLEADMWSGWGIRTLSASNPAYNPFSYQRGSVWPHDNGIIALGFARYGFVAEAARVARDISEAASCFESYRLPELYAGIERQPPGTDALAAFPVQYLGANVPQAWAAGSVFHLLQALLGLYADAPHGQLQVDPHLPHWLPDLTLRGLRVGQAIVSLRFWREGERTRWEALEQQGSLTVVERPWRMCGVAT